MAKTLREIINKNTTLKNIFKSCDHLKDVGQYSNALFFLKKEDNNRYENVSEDAILTTEQLEGMKGIIKSVIKKVIQQVNEDSCSTFLDSRGELNIDAIKKSGRPIPEALKRKIEIQESDKKNELDKKGEKNNGWSDWFKKLENLDEAEKSKVLAELINQASKKFEDKSRKEVKDIGNKIRENKDVTPEDKKLWNIAYINELIKIGKHTDEQLAYAYFEAKELGNKEMIDLIRGIAIQNGMISVNEQSDENSIEIIFESRLKSKCDIGENDADFEKFMEEQRIEIYEASKKSSLMKEFLGMPEKEMEKKIIDSLEKQKEMLHRQRISIIGKGVRGEKENFESDILQIDLLNPENVLFLVKLYTDLEKNNLKVGKRKEAKVFKEKLQEKLMDYIYSKENKVFFEDFFKKENGNDVIDTDILNEKMKDKFIKYSVLFENVQNYIKGKNSSSLPAIHLEFEKIEEVFQDNEKIKKTIEEFLKLSKEEYTEEKTEEKRVNKKTLDSLKRKIIRTKKTTLLSADGKFDIYEIERYYNEVLNTSLSIEDEELGKIIKGFIDVEFSKDKMKAVLPLKKAIVKEHGNKDFETINKLYEEKISKYAERHALENVYVNFQRAKTITRMSFTEQKEYIKSLTYLYSSKNPQKREFAQTIFKYNFPNIQVDETGNIPPEAIEALYQTYEPTEKHALQSIKNTYENQRKYSIYYGKENIDLRNIDFEINLENINNAIRNKKLPEAHFNRNFLPEELEIINKFRTSIDLNNPKNILTLVRIVDCIQEEQRKGKEVSKEHLLLKSTIEQFAVLPEGRTIFAKYLRADRQNKIDIDRLIKDGELDTSIRSEEINPEILKILNFDGEIKIENVESHPKVHEYDELTYTKNLLSIALGYNGNQKRFIENLKSFGLTDIPACRILKKDGNSEGEIDFERVKKISEILNDNFDRRNVFDITAENMAKALRNLELLENYAQNFDDLVQGITEIMEHNLGIPKVSEEKVTSATLRELTWEEYLSRRPASPEEVQDILRTDTRGITNLHDNPYKKIPEELQPENADVITDAEFENSQRAQEMTTIIAEGSIDSDTRIMQDRQLTDEEMQKLVAVELRIGNSEADKAKSNQGTITSSEGQTIKDDEVLATLNGMGEEIKVAQVAPEIVGPQSAESKVLEVDASAYTEVQPEETPSESDNNENSTTESEEKDENKTSIFNRAMQLVKSAYIGITNRIKGIKPLPEGNNPKDKKASVKQGKKVLGEHSSEQSGELSNDLARYEISPDSAPKYIPTTNAASPNNQNKAKLGTKQQEPEEQEVG